MNMMKSIQQILSHSQSPTRVLHGPTMARSILVTFRIITLHLFAGGSCCKGGERRPKNRPVEVSLDNSGRGFGIDGGLMGHDGTGIIAGYSRLMDLRSAVSIYSFGCRLCMETPCCHGLTRGRR